MKFKIPFTNTTLAFGKDAPAEAKRRGKLFGRFRNFDPKGDLTGIKIDFRTFYLLYSRQSDVFGCVREWCDGVGEAGYKWKNLQMPDEPIDEEFERGLDSILNHGRTFASFKGQIIRDLGICGNAFAEIVMGATGEKPVGLATIDPRSMAIVVDEYGEVHRYIQRVAGYDPVIFEPHQIIHFKFGTDPNNESFGYAPIEPIVWEALTDLASMKSNYSFFENDAKPSVVYILEDGLEEDDEKDVMATIKENFGGADNKHKSASIAGVKEIKTIGSTHVEMEFLQQRRFATEKICSAFGVPKFMLGYTESVNNNNGVELNKHFLTKTIRPLETTFESTMNRAFGELIEGFSEAVEFCFNEQSVDSETELEKRGIELFKNGIKTLRETKLFLGHEITEDMEKQENFDKHIIHAGGGARALDDIGVEPFMEAPEDDPNDKKK